jgi:ParB family transcriptional regulator, chromosome partitioning protein
MSLRLIAASVLGKHTLWDVSNEMLTANGNKTIEKSVADSKASAAFDAERKAVRELLGLVKDQAADTCALFARPMAMTDAEVLHVLTFLMARSLPAGSAEVEALGSSILAVDMEKWWTADDAFLELLRDKPAINAIAGKHATSVHVAEPVKARRMFIRASLPGRRAGRRSRAGSRATCGSRCSPTPSRAACDRAV